MRGIKKGDTALTGLQKKLEKANQDDKSEGSDIIDDETDDIKDGEGSDDEPNSLTEEEYAIFNSPLLRDGKKLSDSEMKQKKDQHKKRRESIRLLCAM